MSATRMLLKLTKVPMRATRMPMRATEMPMRPVCLVSVALVNASGRRAPELVVLASQAGMPAIRTSSILKFPRKVAEHAKDPRDSAVAEAVEVAAAPGQAGCGVLSHGRGDTAHPGHAP